MVFLSLIKLIIFKNIIKFNNKISYTELINRLERSSKMSKPYNIGLDIGTNSIGWSVVDEQGKLIRIKSKLGYGVRLFDEGQTAEERRQFRTTRRRLKRRKWRLGLLREMFEPHITPIDESFFMRQKESNLSPQDANKKYPQLHLFNDRTDQAFYNDYPTIYHLRYQLMTEKRQFDLREIYLAMHHIVKYRGHFLNAVPAAAFKSGEVDLEDKFAQLNEIFASTINECNFQLVTDELAEVKTILLNHHLSASKRQTAALPLIYQQTENKALDKQSKVIATEILKAILGLKAKFSVITGQSVDDVKEWTLTFNSEEFDDKLANLSVPEQAMPIIEILRSLYSSILLTGVVPEGLSISQSMIEKYEKHAQHLKWLRQIKQTAPKNIQLAIQAAYDAYIDEHQARDVFYADISKALKALPETDQIKEILNLIALDQFMPKQRAKDNGSIPHQLHQQELDAIIENQKAYYPWLAELNPNANRQKVARYKLDELVCFRVPYYVGPMITSDEQMQTSKKKFAWMIRKEAGTITPWNFDQKVDRQATANQFIKRMTTTDTYLLAEDVLPKQSLLYQRFEVLNELNRIKIDDQLITIEQKQAIFNDLFMRQATVSTKNIQNYLVMTKQYASKPEITGLSDGTKFNSRLSTYHDLKKIFDDLIDAPEKQKDFERCIEWSTIFEDGQIFAEKLKEITWLSDEQRQKVAAKRYRGWGQLSEKLLTQIVDQNGQRIIDILWNTNDTFMKIVHSKDFDQLINQENQALLDNSNQADVINELYTSPQNKKALRQILLVVADIQKAMHQQAPKRIMLEFARGQKDNPKLAMQRKRQVEKAYETIADEFLSDSSIRQELKAQPNSALSNTRLFLYFMQGGIDVYTGLPLNIDRLSEYDIDHILPQSFIKDNSLDNRVLVSAKMNRTKSDQVPLGDFTSEHFGQKMRHQWERMLQAGLITRKKYNYLTLNPDHLSKYAMSGFINRQLVETRQVIKLATNLLMNQFSDVDVQLVTVKSGLTHQMREVFDFPKNRNLNNHHHAFDAYLTAFVGLYLLKKYPKLEPYFVYGQYQVGMKKQDHWRHFNFLNGLKQESVKSDVTDEIIWQREQDLNYMNRIYNFKKILITREVHENHGALYNQTIYKASEDKASGQGAKQLIPIKNNKPTALYGGYSGKTLAYLCLVRQIDKKGDTYRLCGVQTAWADELAQISDKEQLKIRLTALLTPQFTTTKKQKGEIVSVVKPFEVIVPKVMINQLFYDNGQYMTVSSDTYKKNAQELCLDKESVKLLNSKYLITENAVSPMHVYDQIIDQVMQYFPLYDMKQFRKKLADGRALFEQLSWQDQWQDRKLIQIGQKTVLDRILIGLHANAAASDLKILDIATPLGKLQLSSGIVMQPESLIVYQSPSGLFETRIALKDL